MVRRRFLQTLPAAAAAMSAASAEEVPVKLGFDTYSVRAFQWTGTQLLDYAGRLKLDTIQFSALGDYGPLDAQNLQVVKDRAARLGISIDSGMGCICESSRAFHKNGPPARQQLIDGLKVSRAVGSRSMRCYMGSSEDRLGPLPIEAHMENTIKAFRSVRAEAMDLGVRIALENHSGDMQAREVKTIIEESGKDLVAACLDTGNPIWCVEDPLVTLEILAPYVITTHVRDSVVFEHPRGAAGQWVALGDGNVDLVGFVRQFRKLCPQASMQLEIITGRPPRLLPYLEADFWKAFPKMPAWEFARFVALAKSGRPFLGNMVIGQWSDNAPALEAALKEQQRVDLERSLEYAKKKLGVGVRWRG